MTRVAMWFALVIVLLPGPAAAQKAPFVEGLTRLTRAMMTMSPDAGQANAASDTMAAELSVGARVRVTAASRTQVREVRAGSSYLGQHDLRVHFGLGDAATADRVEVTWPAGRVEAVGSVKVNHIVTIHEGRGIVGQITLVR